MSTNIIWELIAKKLSGEASNEELSQLESLLKANPDMHYPIQTVADLWHQSTPNTEDAHLAFSAHAARMKGMGADVEPQKELVFAEEPNSPQRKKYLLLALSLFLLLMAGYYSYSVFFQPATKAAVKATADKSEVSTKYGSRTNLLLPDGTQVWLNSGSKLSYDKTYGNNIREVSLSGEAYFDVVKNPARPFIIHTVSIDIKVLGTAFNVKSFPGEKNTETSLIRGSIEVTFKNRPAEKIILKPNEKLVTANDEDILPQAAPARHIPVAKIIRQEPIVAVSHLTYQPADSTVVETSWMEGKLIFRSESFEDLAVRMERWFGISIQFASNELKDKKFTGIFENETIEQAFAALQLTAPFKYSINKKEVFISK